MANAPDKVKFIADYVTERDNDHAGVTEVIERFSVNALTGLLCHDMMIAENQGREDDI